MFWDNAPKLTSSIANLIEREEVSIRGNLLNEPNKWNKFVLKFGREFLWKNALEKNFFILEEIIYYLLKFAIKLLDGG